MGVGVAGAAMVAYAAAAVDFARADAEGSGDAGVLVDVQLQHGDLVGVLRLDLVEHGRDWERYAYVKARLLTGADFEADVFAAPDVPHGAAAMSDAATVGDAVAFIERAQG